MSLTETLLAPLPSQARYLVFQLQEPRPPGLRARLEDAWPEGAVVGFGPALADALDLQVPGLRPFPAWQAPQAHTPSTRADLWVWLRADDRGDLVHQTRVLTAALADHLALSEQIEAFTHHANRDLTGYEDGTENPKGHAAVEAAIAEGGGSFVSVMRWEHDFEAFERLSPEARDQVMGRRLDDNEELEDAPGSAHVKRTAQESFEPPAFTLRRSMPWAEGGRAGLMFVSFGASLDAFEAQLRRMVGAEDGVIDALFSISRPRTGAHLWCPPQSHGRLAL